jgi:hypothetical protein
MIDKTAHLDSMDDADVITLLISLALARRSPGMTNMIVGYFNYNDIPAIIERIQRIDYDKVGAVRFAIINTTVETMYPV